MHSKQINFFLSPEDIPDVQTFFIETKCLVFKRDSDNQNINYGYDIIKNPESIFQVCLSKREFGNQLFYNRVASNNNYYIDILKSLCIEFSIGGIYPYSNKELHSSRLYYIFEYYANGKLVRKDNEFINWADNIIKEFKKKFLKRDAKYTSDFLSGKFIDWIKENDAKRTTDGTKFII